MVRWGAARTVLRLVGMYAVTSVGALVWVRLLAPDRDLVGVALDPAFAFFVALFVGLVALGIGLGGRRGLDWPGTGL
jgi:hypothetical protein